MGIVGMIIALPCTSLMLSYYQRYIRIKEKEFSGGIEHTDFQHKENSHEKINSKKIQVIYLHISSKTSTFALAIRKNSNNKGLIR